MYFLLTSEHGEVVLRGQPAGERLGGLLVGLLVERDNEDAGGGVVQAVEGAEPVLKLDRKKHCTVKSDAKISGFPEIWQE